jgi:glucose/mannose transport system substrate-binding protein
MRSMLVPCALLAGLGLLSACGSGDPAPPDPVVLELATWWSNVADNRALTALLDVHRKTFPGVTITTLPLSSPQVLASTMRTRFNDGNPPAAFQANLGTGALTWGQSAESLNMASVSWLSEFDSRIIEQLTFNGTLIGVPLGLTRQNVAYWNVKILRPLADPSNPKISKMIPETTADFETWLVELTGLGYKHPICFGGKDTAVSAQVLFDHILPGVAGGDFSKEFWSGKGDANDPKLTEAMTFAKEVVSVLTPNFIEMTTNDGLTKLVADESDIANQCLVAPGGDAGWQLLVDRALPNEHFTATGWPGKVNNKLVVFAGDTFVAAKGAGNRDAVYDFFNTMASKEAQIRFAREKGSMPARKVAPAERSQFLKVPEFSLDDINDPAGGGVASYQIAAKVGYPIGNLASAARDFFQTGDTASLLTYLKDNYSLLQ